VRRAAPRRANTTDPHSRVIPQASTGVIQGYNAQAAATAEQIVLAAEVTAATNDQTQFIPMATAVSENLADAGHEGKVGVFLADAGYWSAANGTADVGAEVLIATRKTAWRKADEPDDDKLAILAKVNRGELSQRKAGDMLGVSYTWVRDMTKRYFGQDGQRITRTAEPEPEEWLPVIERLARGEISKRAAAGSTPCWPTFGARPPTPPLRGQPWTPNSPTRPTLSSTRNAATPSNPSSATSRPTSVTDDSAAAACPP